LQPSAAALPVLRDMQVFQAAAAAELGVRHGMWSRPIVDTESRGDEPRPRMRRCPVRRRGWNPAVVVPVTIAVVVALGLTIWGGVHLLRSKNDPRLIGTWQSDADATIAHRKTTHAVTEKNEAAMRKLFGKLKITYTARDLTTDLNGVVETLPYQVVSKDAESVTIREYSPLEKKDVVVRIRFVDADTYWIDVSNELFSLSECFRRVN
jgi:hypothetical protein